MRTSWVVLVVALLAAACSSQQKPAGSGGSDGAAATGGMGGTGSGGTGSGGTGGTSGGDSGGSTLLRGMVCGGEISDCPSNPPGNASACVKDGLCCVYQLAAPGTSRGCICDQAQGSARWVCRDQPCGCRGQM
jgi:hypothetical protein